MSEKDYEPFNESGTMCPPSPEMIEEQISWDETAECPHGIGFYEECELCTPYGGEVPDILNCADFTKPNP